MPFERGSVSLRVFRPARADGFPEDPFAKFAADSIPPVEAMREPCVGWSTGHHLLDRNITEETAKIAGRIRVSLVKAEKKIPAALFKAECKQEEMARMAAKNVPFLPRAERAEIAAEVRERMVPTMPPSLSAIDVVREDSGVLFTSACSVAQSDLLAANWVKTTGQQVYPLMPMLLATVLTGCKQSELNPTSFSPEVPNDQMEQDIGTEFLTWLWYFSEAEGGMNDGFAFAVEGPFTFVHEGAGAHVVVVRNGNPGVAQETKSALLAGKKLLKAKLTVAKGDVQWTCTLNGSEWTFGSLKLPKSETKDPSGIFDERMASISTFLVAFQDLFGRFVKIRIDSGLWQKEVEKVRAWVSARIDKA